MSKTPVRDMSIAYKPDDKTLYVSNDWGYCAALLVERVHIVGDENREFLENGRASSQLVGLDRETPLINGLTVYECELIRSASQMNPGDKTVFVAHNEVVPVQVMEATKPSLWRSLRSALHLVR